MLDFLLLWEYNQYKEIMKIKRRAEMERYPITEKDRELIEIGLDVLEKNFDDGVYNHTVGCAILCKKGERFTALCVAVCCG